MARIDFKWAEPKLNTYDHVNADDFFAALPADYQSDKKPLLIYVTSKAEEDQQEMANVESSVLRDESISIGATMFRSIKIDGTKIREGHPYWKTLGGKELPRMVVVDATGKKVGMCEGKQVSSSKVYSAMERAAAKSYKTDLGTIVKETKTILTEIDQVEAKRKALETRKASDTSGRPDKWVKEEKELDAAMKAIEAREKSLRVKWEGGKVTKA